AYGGDRGHRPTGEGPGGRAVTAGPAPVAVSLTAVRWIVTAVCALGIAGMIVASVNDNNDAALTFGLLTSAAVVCLVVATAVAKSGASAAAAAARSRTAPPPPLPLDEAQAAAVEAGVQRLVAAGADEAEVRALVGEAVRLGRGGAPVPGQ
ncbi:MAG: hypothetical protein ACRD0N_13320, partial [Acidimicrobiales bacterium]